MDIKYNDPRACVLTIKDVKTRRQQAKNKQKKEKTKLQARNKKQNDWLFFLISKDLMQLGPNSVIPHLLPKNKNVNNFLFQNTFYKLLQIIPDIFAEIVIDNPKSKTLI